MAYAYQSVGTVASELLSTGGDTLSPGAPSGVATGDLLLCAVLSRQTPVTVAITGYELLDTQGRLSVFGRIATGTDDTPVVSVNVSTTGYSLAQYARFAGSFATIGTAGADIRDQAAAESSAALNDIVTGTQSTPSVAGCLILYVGGKLNNLGAYTALPNGSTLIDSTSGTTENLHLIWSYAIQTTAASVAGSLFNFADDANTYYSTVLTLKPSAAIKYLKFTTHPGAASATSAAGVVFSAPSTGNLTGSTRYGEFTGKTFEASTEGSGTSKRAVLKVPVADFGGIALTTSDSPVAVVRTSTFASGPVTCTVIEE